MAIRAVGKVHVITARMHTSASSSFNGALDKNVAGPARSKGHSFNGSAACNTRHRSPATERGSRQVRPLPPLFNKETTMMRREVGDVMYEVRNVWRWAVPAGLILAGCALVTEKALAQTLCAATELESGETCHSISGVPNSMYVENTFPQYWELSWGDAGVASNCAEGKTVGLDRDDFPARYQTLYGTGMSLGAAEVQIRDAFAGDGCWLQGLSEWLPDIGSTLEQYRIPMRGDGTAPCYSSTVYRYIQPVCSHGSANYLDHQGNGDDICVVGTVDTSTADYDDEYATAWSAWNNPNVRRAITVQYVKKTDGTCTIADDGVRFLPASEGP